MNIVFGLIAASVLFTLTRLIKGPSLADRAVAIDTFNIIIIGVISILALIFNNDLILDVAIIYGILAFIETVVFARFLEGQNE